MKVVAFATVKLDSERVPHKNLQLIGSRPLCYHIVNTALQVSDIDRVCVYCSDPEVTNHIPACAEFVQREAWLDGSRIKAKVPILPF